MAALGTFLKRAMTAFPPVRTFIDNAFRIEDDFHAFRAKWVRRRGFVMIVEPYTGYGSTSEDGEGWIRVLARVQMSPPQRRRTSRLRRRKERVIRGWRSFTRVSVGNVTAVVIIDGVRHRVKADRGGVIDAHLPSPFPSGWHSIQLESFDGRVSEAPVFVVDHKQQYGVISDIDDTVMVTALPRPLLAAWNTFVLDEHARTPTPGMNVFYERLIEQFGRGETPMVYLSTGPWNVAPTLSRFLGRNLYPAGPLLLTDWGPTPERLFRSGFDHKVDNLRRLASEFPQIRWVLIGDDGQHDEEIYGKFLQEHPENVLLVAIRQLSTSEAVLAGGRAISHRWRRTSPVPWLYAPDGSGLVKQLRAQGIFDALED